MKRCLNRLQGQGVTLSDERVKKRFANGKIPGPSLRQSAWGPEDTCRYPRPIMQPFLPPGLRWGGNVVLRLPEPPSGWFAFITGGSSLGSSGCCLRFHSPSPERWYDTMMVVRQPLNAANRRSPPGLLCS